MLWLTCQHVIENDIIEEKVKFGEEVWCPYCNSYARMQAFVSLKDGDIADGGTVRIEKEPTIGWDVE